MLSPYPDSFEVWDPVTAESFVLPSPSFRFASINSYFLNERGIVMSVSDFTTYFFNIHDETWETWKYRTPGQIKEKKSEISADFSAIFRFSVGVEKKNPWKKSTEKISAKNRRFFPENSKNSDIFPKKSDFSRNLG